MANVVSGCGVGRRGAVAHLPGRSRAAAKPKRKTMSCTKACRSQHMRRR